MNERVAQRGFTLLETLVATALTVTLILSVTAAVLGSLHASARLGERAELTDHALNILSDLRETTAYDANALTAMTGRSVTTTFPADASNARVLTATIGVAQSGASAPVIASVTVTDANGESVTEQQTLYFEAPAPGSVIDQATPTPAAGE